MKNRRQDRRGRHWAPLRDRHPQTGTIRKTEGLTKNSQTLELLKVETKELGEEIREGGGGVRERDERVSPEIK